MPSPSTTTASSSGNKALPGQRIVTLAKEPSKPATLFTDYTWLLYGRPKIGKTTLASCFPDAYFLMFEPGAKALEIYQSEVKDWLDFRAYVTALTGEEGRQFRTIVLDVVDVAYEYALKYVCGKQGIDHPSAVNDYGRTWNAVKTEFLFWCQKLMVSGKGVVFISHDKVQEMQERSGRKLSVITPSMAPQAFEVLKKPVDMIAYYNFFGSERRLVIEGNELITAGSRIKGHFYAEGTEKSEEPTKIVSIKVGHSEEVAFANVQRAFENKETFIGDDIRLDLTGQGAAKLDPTKVKPGGGR